MVRSANLKWSIVSPTTGKEFIASAWLEIEIRSSFDSYSVTKNRFKLRDDKVGKEKQTSSAVLIRGDLGYFRIQLEPNEGFSFAEPT